MNWTPEIVTCPCGEMFEQRIWGQKYCRPEHRAHPPRPGRKQLSAARRGYDYQHQLRRRAALAALVPGTSCPRCGEEMYPDQALHFDHDDTDRNVYLGLSHARCNLSAGAVRGNRRRARPWWQNQRTQLALFRPPRPKAPKPRAPLKMRRCACGAEFPAKGSGKTWRCQDCRMAAARQAVHMRTQEGLPWKDIAAALGFVSVGSVYKLAERYGGSG